MKPCDICKSRGTHLTKKHHPRGPDHIVPCTKCKGVGQLPDSEEEPEADDE